MDARETVDKCVGSLAVRLATWKRPSNVRVAPTFEGGCRRSATIGPPRGLIPVMGGGAGSRGGRSAGRPIGGGRGRGMSPGGSLTKSKTRPANVNDPFPALHYHLHKTRPLLGQIASFGSCLSDQKLIAGDYSGFPCDPLCGSFDAECIDRSDEDRLLQTAGPY